MNKIYVLKLKNNKFYVGKTTNLQQRLADHHSGYGSSWTKLHTPIKLIEEKETKDSFDEDKTVLSYMVKYGIDNVRGGSFSQLVLSKNDKSTIKKMLKSGEDTCYHCGKKGHFIRDCPDIEYCIISSSEEESNSEEESSSEDDSQNCYRCGRNTHFARDCYATYHIKGHKLKK